MGKTTTKIKFDAFGIGFEISRDWNDADIINPSKDQAICKKVDVDFKLFAMEFGRKSVPRVWSEIEKEIRDNDYHPFTILSNVLRIRVDNFILPLILNLLESESNLRRKNLVPMSTKRVQELANKSANIVKEEWELQVYGAYEAAYSHVEYHQGRVADYKKKELENLRDDFLSRTDPLGLLEYIGVLLKQAYVDSHLN
jgi:hypothetical protein